MQLSAPYRSIDKAGWHFIVLDSIQPKTNGTWFTCMLDEAQFDWLQKDLAATPAATPIVVVSHVPFMSAAVVVTENKMKE